MKLVLVFVAVLWTECSGMTDLGSCTTVTDSQVCGDITADPNGCSVSVGWGDQYYSWNCNGEDFQCHRQCHGGVDQPSECEGIETRCQLHDSHGVCEEFEGDCGFGSRNVTWYCGIVTGFVGCPVLCCCTGCASTSSIIPQPQVCDDLYDELACAQCPDGMHRDIRVPGSCFVHVQALPWVVWDDARDNCVTDYGGWLMEITDKSRFEVAADMADTIPGQWSWVGGHADATDLTLRQWVTHSSPPMTIDNSMWGPTQPNNFLGEDCIAMSNSFGGTGLHDAPCTWLLKSICEYILP